jgi:hypothetical protein
MRLRYKRPDDTTWQNFTNETTSTVTHNANTRQIIHKDNTGDHDEHLYDGKSGTVSVSAFHENAGVYADLLAAYNASETLDIQFHDGTTGNELQEFDILITSLAKTATVRETVSFQLNGVITGSVTLGTVS